LQFIATTAIGLSLLVVVNADARPDTRHAAPAARRTAACRVPRLTGLTVSGARKRAAEAGCRVRLLGAPVKRPEVQTIRGQTAHPRPLQAIAVWVNPLCSGSAEAGPPHGEPFLAPGPTGLLSGLYLDGGPHRFRSAPRCASIAGTPSPGTIAVSDPLSGAVVADKSVAEGRLASIALPPGTYVIVGTFANSFTNGQHIQSFPRTITIVAGKTVRQDVSVGIP
jgi:hypothetical protein